MEQKKHPMNIVDNIMMRAEIDWLLYKDEDTSRFNPYSLSPVKTEARFKHGSMEPPAASKETKALKSVLESGQYVSEVPILKVNGSEFELLGPFKYRDDDKIEVEMPGSNRIYYVNAGKLKRILDKYVIRVYEEREKDGWVTVYAIFSVDNNLLFKNSTKR